MPQKLKFAVKAVKANFKAVFAIDKSKRFCKQNKNVFLVKRITTGIRLI